MKVAFYTLGCKVNQYETDIMIENVIKSGFEIVDFDKKADFYIINSCSVTNMSTRKTRQYLSRAKKQGGIVVLVGCYAQELTSDTKLENIDIILGNEEKIQIANYLNKYASGNSIQNVGDISKSREYNKNEYLQNARNIRESVKIEDGCDNFCSYCIIPYVRGRVRSRSISDITMEVRSLVDSGVGEVVLVGIEIASYGKDFGFGENLIDVIEEVSKIEGLSRIRLGSIEPRILTNENIIRLSKISKLCPHFHISVQSLDDNVLKQMNRKYDTKFLFSRIEELKKHFSDIALTCDIIVGFPGEGEEEFVNTYNNLKKSGFYEVHVFKYSKRKWTKAANMDNQVDGAIATKRSGELIKLASELREDYITNYLYKTLNVLFEEFEPSDNDNGGFLYGYTPNYIKVKVEGDNKLWGKQHEVELHSLEGDILIGSLLK